jgi:hypothetical protein
MGAARGRFAIAWLCLSCDHCLARSMRRSKIIRVLVVLTLLSPMLSAFLDEAGTGDDSPVMCVAGFLYTRKNLRQLDRQWKRALDDAAISHFHMSDYAHSKGEFKGKVRALGAPAQSRSIRRTGQSSWRRSKVTLL